MLVPTLETRADLGEAVGVGVDMAEVAEFRTLPFEEHLAFYRRIFSPAEIDYCRSQASAAEHFAVRFAAKEAAVKALSSVAQLGYWQIEVVRSENGAPVLRFWNEERRGPLAELEPYRSLVSLSHTETLAIAFVVVYERRN